MSNSEINTKRNAIINACLEQFVDKGLYATTSRDLSKALNLQSAGMYSYFENKDAAVIACAEQAALKLEQQLFAVTFNCLEKENVSLAPVKKLATQLSPMMRFFTQVCSTDKYEERMRPILKRLSQRYKTYVVRIAQITAQDVATVSPLVYIGITAVVNFMVYQEDNYIDPLLALIEDKLSKGEK